MLFLLSSANSIKAFKMNTSQFFFTPTLLPKGSVHLNTEINLVMQINYLTIYFKGTYSLLPATTLLVNLSYTSQCMHNIYMKMRNQLCLEKRTVRSDGTEARAFSCFSTHLTKKVCIYVFIFVRDLKFYVVFIFQEAFSVLRSLTPAEAQILENLSSSKEKQVVTIQLKPSNHCQLALACKFSIQSQVMFAIIRCFL